MILSKIAQKLNKLSENYCNNILIKNINRIDIENSEYLIILNQAHSRFSEKLYTIVSHELSICGVANFFLYKNDFLSPHCAKLVIDGYKISNSLIIEKMKRLVKSAYSDKLFFDWIVEIQNERIEAEGINFFPIIRSTLRKLQKRYNISFFDGYNKPVYNDLIKSCDLLLKYFLLLRNYSKRTNKRIRIVGGEISLIPNGIFKILCDQLSDRADIQFVELERGNISLFGKHHFRESYVSCSNLTKTKLSDGWSISKEEFAFVRTEEIEFNDLLEPISHVLEKRIYSRVPERQREVIRKMDDYKSRGKRIFVLFGHLFYDTPLQDESPAFNGMCEWIVQTIEHFRGKEDLLLIKPHPSEDRKDLPKKIPNETFVSFLSNKELYENIILLNPRLFTVKDLAPFMSCGLIWRSSVAMELTFLGIPCIIGGRPYYNILDLNFAKDREHYFYMIDHSNELEINDKHKTDVTRYLYSLKKKHLHIECIKYDKTLDKLYWDRKALKKYLRKGDERIRLVVENMLL